MKLTVLTFRNGIDYRAFVCEEEIARKKTAGGLYQFATDSAGGDALEAYILGLYNQIIAGEAPSGHENGLVIMKIAEERWYYAEARIGVDFDHWLNGTLWN